MPKVTNYDILTFFYCVLSGVALSVIADILRAVRKYFRLSALPTFITDVFFFIIAALATFFMQFVYSNGGIRFYILFGELCGFLAARAAISPLNNRLFRLLNRIISAIVKPVKKILCAIIRKISPLIAKIIKNIRLYSKNVLKYSCGLVYNVFNRFFGNTAKKPHKSSTKSVRRNGKKKKRR